MRMIRKIIETRVLWRHSPRKAAAKAFSRSRAPVPMFVSIGIMVVFGVVAVMQPAHAQQVGGWVASTMTAIAQIIIELVGKLLIVLIDILLAIVQYNDFINAPAVTRSWILVRDFSNMAFLIVFIAIALSTILGFERYEWKRTLPKLLIMAVVINFSKTLCGAVIDAAQVIMMTFVNGFKDVAAGNLVRGFGLNDILTLRAINPEGSGVTDVAVAGASMLAVVLLVIATITVGVIVLMFLVRILYLWILIILSPLAFMLGATPEFDAKFHEWWKTFVRYAFVGPILSFFLWLSFSIMADVPAGGNLATANSIMADSGGRETGFLDVAGNTAATITAISSSDNLLSFGIAISLLLLGLSTANSIGVRGGSLAADALSKIKSGGIKLAKVTALGVATGGIGIPLSVANQKIAQKIGLNKGMLEGAKYLEKKSYAKWGYGLDPRRLKRAVQEKLAENKRRDAIKGADKAAQRMRKGGLRGLYAGAMGAPRDFAEAYLQGGFLYHRGLRRAARSVVGGPQKARNLLHGKRDKNGNLVEEGFEQIKKRAQEASSRAGMREKALDKKDFIDDGREVYIDTHVDDRAAEIRASFFGDEKHAEEMTKIVTDARLREQYGDDKVGLEKAQDELKANHYKSLARTQLNTEINQILSNQKRGDTLREGEKNRLAEINKLGKEKLGKEYAAAPKDSIERENLKILINAPDMDDTRRNEIKVEMQDMRQEAGQLNREAEAVRAQAQKYVPPQTFYANRDRRALMEEERKKITSELDTELISDFRGALAENNWVKGAALAQKLAADANDNELWNAFGFDSGMQGMHDFINAVMIGDKTRKDKFGNDILGSDGNPIPLLRPDGTPYTGPDFGMDRQAAYALENDISYINERVKHWNTARCMGSDETGVYYQMDEKDHVKSAIAEILKDDPSNVIRGYNRLAYGGEIPRADGSGRDFHIEGLGLAILKAFAPEYMFRYGRSEYNKNAVMNLGTPRMLDDLARYNVDPKWISATADKANKLYEEAGEDVDSIVEGFWKMYQEGVNNSLQGYVG